ncbi:hypothetical protein F750_6497 [Streptomyces sp. PAMC 26508]|nr:hypothetical protein F750_6497 [Streptomyces sp. PAMC 26508]
MRTCDGSDLQRWVLRPEGDNNSRWWIWQPKVDTDLAMTLNRYNGRQLEHPLPGHLLPERRPPLAPRERQHQLVTVAPPPRHRTERTHRP